MKTLKSLPARAALLGVLVLLSLPAMAQRVRYDHNGQADVVATNLLIVEAAVVRDLTGMPPERMGQVVFFRASRMGGGDLVVHDNGTRLHNLARGNWFVALAPIGVHHYTVDGRALALDVQPGQAYYVRASADGGAARLSRSNAMVFLNAAGSRPLPQL